LKLRVQPVNRLHLGTNYTFYVNSDLNDAAGGRMIPYAIGFTTTAPRDPVVRFKKVALPATENVGFTAVQVGPDGCLYGGGDDGRIYRFAIRSDGTVASATIIDTLQREGGPRLLTGICFDPASSADEPIMWVSHGFYGFNNAPDWSGKITRLSGRDCAMVEDVVVGLPRSVRDHLTNQPSFGPDGALYFPQGSNTAFGAADADWGMRPERLLTAAILRLDVRRVTPGQPLDARTPDGGGTYNPYRPDAPLTIYASGVRLAYDLLWANDGKLYVPTNGSAAGGNTPGADALKSISISEDDWLFRIAPGKYHGHPNPQRGQYILNGGNPTPAYDFAEVCQYPVGTRPEADWVPAVHVFGKHVSANGIIQYKSSAFGGKLRDSLLVCRYNVPGDIAVLQINANGTITPATKEVGGFGNLSNPLDLAEDPNTGCIYVSEYGARRIMLLRPISQP
jgi:glucose/arabinose dehydrogenase